MEDIVYKLRGIPSVWNGGKVTESDVRTLVTEAWPQCQERSIDVRDLEADPRSPELMVATLALVNPLSPCEISTIVRDEAEEPHALRLSLKLQPVEKQGACLQNLSYPDQNYREAEIELADGTCDWILGHDGFRKWDSAPGKLLWICGPSGAGKSTVMKRITQHLKKSDGRLVLSYFFDGRTSSIHSSPQGCYRHLLSQVLPYEPMYLAELSRVCKMINLEKDRGGSTTDLLHQQFMRFLPGIASQTPLTILIDGLDEAGAMKMASEFRALWSSPHRSNVDLKVCISCHDPARWASDGDLEADVEMHNRDDIRKFVHLRLGEEEDPDWIKLEEHIQQKAAGNFQWARLVATEMARLKRDGCDLPALERRLKTIPGDLTQLYRRLMEDVDAEETPRVIQMFHWLCFVKRPFSIAELQDARDSSGQILKVPDSSDMERYIEESSRGLMEVKTRLLPDASRLERIRFVHSSVPHYLLNGGLQHLAGGELKPLSDLTHRHIMGICLNYLRKHRLVEETRERSAAAEMLLGIDALLKSENTWTSDDVLRVSKDIEMAAKTWNLDLQSDHDLSSINTLSFPKARSYLKEAFSWLASSIARQTMEQYPFANYIISALNSHFRAVDGTGLPVVSLVDTSFWSPESSFFEAWRYLSIVLHPYNKLSGCFDTSNTIDRPIGGTTPLHYIAQYSFLSSLQPALKNHSTSHLSLHNAAGHTPLTTAITARNYTIANTLLSSSNIDPNIPDTTSNRRTPLIHAILCYSPTTNANDEAYNSLLTTLIAHPATIHSHRDANDRTPLIHAASHAHLLAIHLLLAQPAEAVALFARDDDFRTAFSHAAQAGSAPAFAAISDAATTAAHPEDGIAAIVDEPDASGRTPLSYAAEAGAAAIVEALLAQGARIGMVDAQGMTALDHAVRAKRKGTAQVVGLLLGAREATAPVNTDETRLGVAMEPREVLAWAIDRGQVRLLQSVLEDSSETYLDSRTLGKVRAMVGVEEKEAAVVGGLEYGEDDGGDGAARVWIRDHLGSMETKMDNLSEIKRLMEERKKKKEEERKREEKANAVVEVMRISSKL
ncbi:Vegetative incompatibility protein HET-E-1 [Lasiodiplodia hormozganensis]|uniref:Vegetative incompatibility protein HET-E-1 n=1 Tax=Lasiodiplodia hormozganensis TaxID=869390 RepID=A0AA39XUF1_9PEZI|nr:Vegetative incompatibility protein HET-E-1 [Lasiodiplodia hormozganensis]